MNTPLKKCPHCAELIQADAQVCRYCNRDVNTTKLIADQVGNIGKSLTSLGCSLTILIPILMCVCFVMFAFLSGA